MSRSVTAPDGTVWHIRTTRVGWRPRIRKSFELDPAGLLLWVASLPLFLVELVAAAVAAVVGRLRRTAVGRWDVEAVTAPPGRRLVWKRVSDREQTMSEIADGISAGADIASTADTREVG